MIIIVTDISNGNLEQLISVCFNHNSASVGSNHRSRTDCECDIFGYRLAGVGIDILDIRHIVTVSAEFFTEFRDIRYSHISFFGIDVAVVLADFNESVPIDLIALKHLCTHICIAYCCRYFHLIYHSKGVIRECKPRKCYRVCFTCDSKQIVVRAYIFTYCILYIGNIITCLIKRP